MSVLFNTTDVRISTTGMLTAHSTAAKLTGNGGKQVGWRVSRWAYD
jgi:hypothetical protein